MNYYNHHIGDFMRDTAYLSATEEGIYRRALDWYYANEKPLPTDIKLVCRYLRAREEIEIEAVNFILSEFFVLTDEGYTQSRCEKEIEAYSDKAETNRLNGKKGGRPKKEPNNNPEKTQSVNSGFQKDNPNERQPVASSQEPVASSQDSTLSQNASEDSKPDHVDENEFPWHLKKLNDMLKISGHKPIDQIRLVQTLQFFNPHFEGHALSPSQRYSKLCKWIIGDDQKNKSTHSKPVFDSQQNQSSAMQTEFERPEYRPFVAPEPEPEREPTAEELAAYEAVKRDLMGDTAA